VLRGREGGKDEFVQSRNGQNGGVVCVCVCVCVCEREREREREREIEIEINPPWVFNSG